MSRTTLLDETLSRLEAQLLGLENHCAPDIVLNAVHQHGGQVHHSTLGLAFNSNYNCDCDIALLNQIHPVYCSHPFLLENAM